MSSSPTQRSLEYLRDQGYYAEIVERYNSFSKTRNDLLGFADIFCIHRTTGDVKLVQTTSASNFSARINKITGHENLSLARKAGFGIEVHGWKKSRGKWVLRSEDIA